MSEDGSGDEEQTSSSSSGPEPSADKLTLCLHLYSRLLLALKKPDCAVVQLRQLESLERVADEYGRLKVWALQTEAWSMPPTSQTSGTSSSLAPNGINLNIRLLRALGRLSECLFRALQIANKPYNGGANADEDADFEEMSSGSSLSGHSSSQRSDQSRRRNRHGLHRTSSKISLLIRYIFDHIQVLYSYSGLLRRPGAAERLIGPAAYDAGDSVNSLLYQFDLAHVMEKVRCWNRSFDNYERTDQKAAEFGDDECTATIEILRARQISNENNTQSPLSIITRRLAQANVRRRKRTMYRKQQLPPNNVMPHGGTLTPRQSSAVGLETTSDRPSIIVERPEDRIHALEAIEAPQQPILTVQEAIPNKASSSASPNSHPQTEYEKTIYTGGSKVVVPPIPQTEQAKFLCPYCHLALERSVMEDRYRWKRHVFRDLQPYICTFVDCLQSEKLYATRHEWKYHEMQMHRRCWKCQLCDSELLTQDSMALHLRTRHLIDMNAWQVSSALEICEQPLDESNVASCLLCQRKLPLSMLLDHLAKHMEDLSLFAFQHYRNELDAASGQKEQVNLSTTIADEEREHQAPNGIDSLLNSTDLKYRPLSFEEKIQMMSGWAQTLKPEDQEQTEETHTIVCNECGTATSNAPQDIRCPKCNGTIGPEQQLRELPISSSLERGFTASGQPRKDFREPSTEAEHYFQSLLADILGLEASSISLDDNLFELGIDSLAAVELAMASQESGYPVSVPRVFQQPTLRALASPISAEKVARSSSSSNSGGDVSDAFADSTHTMPSSASRGSQDDSSSEAERKGWRHSTSTLPVTNFQALCVSAALQAPKLWWHSLCYDISPSPDISVLIKSIHALYQRLDILRTEFVRFPKQERLHAYFRRVSKNHYPNIIDLDVVNNGDRNVRGVFDEFCKRQLYQPANTETPLVRFIIISSRINDTARVGVSLSGALSDSTGMRCMMEDLRTLCQGKSLPDPVTFASVLEDSLRSSNDAHQYWKSLIGDAPMTSMAPLDASATGPFLAKWRTSNRTVSPIVKAGNLTRATIFTSICAVALAKVTFRKTVLFGRVVSVRPALKLDSQRVVGPCMSVVPIRVDFSDNEPDLGQAQSQVQTQFINGIRYETMAIDGARGTHSFADFGCIVRYQNLDDDLGISFDDDIDLDRLQFVQQPSSRYGCVEVFAHPRGDGLQISIHGSFVDANLLDLLLEEICQLI